MFDFKYVLFQMTTSSYPGMAQSFSMSHGSNMSSVAGMRQDAMSKYSMLLKMGKFKIIIIQLEGKI